MDFSLSDEQQMLSDAIARFVSNEYSFERRRQLIESGDSLWPQIAELGWLCVPFSERFGGLGGQLADLAVVMEQLGRGLLVEPYFSTAVLAGPLLARLGSESQCEQLIGSLVAGELRLALAQAEPEAHFALNDVRTAAKRSGEGWRIDGRKAVVLHGGEADCLLVVARSSGERYDHEGLSLFLVARDAPGIRVSSYATVDGQRAADIDFDQVSVDADALLGAPGEAWPALKECIERACLALCAEAVGIMDLLLERTVDYAKTRVQFGQPIARFQALQHRMADMFIECQQARSIMLMAVLKADAGTEDLERLAAAAKARVGAAARRVGQEAIQIHGGIGVTEEFDVGHYFKRLTVICQQFGSSGHHLARYAELSAAQLLEPEPLDGA